MYCRMKAMAKVSPPMKPPHGDDEEIDGVGKQRQADDHLECARPKDQPDA
jgi:hypothetical protein